MTDQHPAVTFLLAAHERAVALAEKATKGPWTAKPVIYGPPEDGWGEPSDWEIEAPGGTVVSHQTYEGGGIGVQADADHIALHHPDTVLLRVAAERDILTERVAAKEQFDEAVANPDQVHPADAGIFVGKFNAFTRAVVGLAKAWGWKEPT